MNEILIAFTYSMLLGLFSMIKFDKICIIVSSLTLLIANYTYGFDKASVNITVVILWIVFFYMAIMKALDVLKKIG